MTSGRHAGGEWQLRGFTSAVTYRRRDDLGRHRSSGVSIAKLVALSRRAQPRQAAWHFLLRKSAESQGDARDARTRQTNPSSADASALDVRAAPIG